MALAALWFSRLHGNANKGLSSLAQVIQESDTVAVIGDGKLGLLVAQVLITQGVSGLVHLGKHREKLSLVQGSTWEVVDESTSSHHAQVRIAVMHPDIHL